jgi:hypothetical protein
MAQNVTWKTAAVAHRRGTKVCGCRIEERLAILARSVAVADEPVKDHLLGRGATDVEQLGVRMCRASIVATRLGTDVGGEI